MTLRRQMLATAFALVALFVPGRAAATPIQYHVLDLITGAAGVSGTITTDGTLGVLTLGNLVAWDLVITDGTNTASVKSGVNGSMAHTSAPGLPALTATLTELRFDFSGGADDLSFVDASPFDGQLCYTNYGNCWGLPAVGVYNVGGVPSGSFFTALSGVQVIASGGSAVAPVPEPSTLALAAAGLVALVASRANRASRRRRRATAE